MASSPPGAPPGPPPGPPPALPDLGPTHGALLVTSYLSVIMYGTALFQVYLYFTRYPRDSTFTKSLVTCVWITDTVQTAFTIAASYWWLITNYFNPATLSVGYWSFDVLFHVDALLALYAQGFFARRVWVVSHRNKPLSALLFTAVLIRFGLFNAIGAEVWVKQTFAGVATVRWLMILGLTFSMVTDLAITGSLIFFLHQSRTGFNRTDSMINQIIIYSMTTALLPCILDIIVVICVGVMPNNLIYPGVHLLLTKTYPNTLLATLNTREIKSVNGSHELRSTHGGTSTIGGASGYGVNSHSGFKGAHQALASTHPMQRGVLVTQEQYSEQWGSATNIVADPTPQKPKKSSDIESL